MRDLDLLVREAFHGVVPDAAVEPPDWEEVLRRAQVGDGALRERPRRRLVLAVGLALLAAAAAALVNPAWGIGERILEGFRGTPAPRAVQRDLVVLNELPPDAIPWARVGGDAVLVERARGVVAIETSAGVARLWVAPIRGGGTCRYVDVANRQVDPQSSGVCRAEGARDRPLIASVVDGPALLHGRAPSGTASVELVLDDGQTARLKLVDRYFLAEIPQDAQAAAIVARDASGRRLAHERLDEWLPPRVDPLSPKQPTEVELKPILQARLSDGTRARVLASEGSRERCVRVVTERGGAVSAMDSCGGVRPRPTQIQVSTKNQLLVGEVGERVASVKLESADGSSTDIPLKRGWFLFEVPRGQVAVGVIGRDARGRVLTTERIEVPWPEPEP